MAFQEAGVVLIPSKKNELFELFTYGHLLTGGATPLQLRFETDGRLSWLTSSKSKLYFKKSQ
jgi:hypothetical protein